MKVAAIVHVFYPEMWSELRDCIKNAKPDDLTVTYVDEESVVEAKRDFPGARFILCENRGYDVWPFVTALKAIDLDAFDLVVKLHTKRDIKKPHPFVMNGARLNGAAWRNYLLAFVKTPEAWKTTCAMFENPSVGLVAEKHLIYGRTEGGKNWFDDACRELKTNFGLTPRKSDYFVGGTMFVARASLLKVFAAHPFRDEQFAMSGSHEPTTYAHLMERMLGLAIAAQGFRLAGFNGSVAAYRLGWALRRFLYENRWSERRHTIRVFGITAYRRKLA